MIYYSNDNHRRLRASRLFKLQIYTICLTYFSKVRGNEDRRLAKKKRFLMYFVYATGVPFLYILIMLLINVFGDKEAFYYPGIGDATCFLNGEYTF